MGRSHGSTAHHAISAGIAFITCVPVHYGRPDIPTRSRNFRLELQAWPRPPGSKGRHFPERCIIYGLVLFRYLYLHLIPGVQGCHNCSAVPPIDKSRGNGCPICAHINQFCPFGVIVINNNAQNAQPLILGVYSGKVHGVINLICEGNLATLYQSKPCDSAPASVKPYFFIILTVPYAAYLVNRVFFIREAIFHRNGKWIAERDLMDIVVLIFPGKI